jgi:hypothetical protein
MINYVIFCDYYGEMLLLFLLRLINEEVVKWTSTIAPSRGAKSDLSEGSISLA